ncbi:MAG: tRNA preQ1(34) S-adenosylmethionine ribosyltransferase-isomerase QueA [Oscillospiraceae bacterium]|nr:tRNA preQ1(34) S-adenosylmethionine ribosyltransferase-isomerase QueA [Oscillospiraceae bacterium]
MKKSDFYYELPEQLIAQTPIEPRDASRLLKIDRGCAPCEYFSNALTHSNFYSLADFLNKGDLLILNDSKVFPARLLGVKENTGVPVEFLLLEQKEKDIWETMVHPGRRLKKGSIVCFGEELKAEVLGSVNDGNRLVRFESEGDFYALLDRIGNTPLPPYITEKLEDKTRYNTIYSRYDVRGGERLGSAAAPTAGLHFTERVFESLAGKGIETAYITLHVGLGTFRPVKAEIITEHKMHRERYVLPEETARKIAECKAQGGRVIPVGTTACRTLEASGGKTGSGSTDIFIYPGYKFKLTDGLLTNFHLPESTLIMLVSAFLGREKTLNVYEAAIREKYRFFSFGDCMLII